jgi:lipoate-protein ligase A
MFDRPTPDRPTARILDSTSTVVVLGSTQPQAVVVPGTPTIRRRSGGGAVLVEPDALVWVDVFIPAGDKLWEADVGRAFHWLGDIWRDALVAVGVARPEVHRGPLLTTPWSRLVCFAGLGPGEVTVDGAKVVGIAQRRTRAGALFQCAALLEWRPERLLERLALSEDDRRRGVTELAGVARPVDVDADALVAALLFGLR